MPIVRILSALVTLVAVVTLGAASTAQARSHTGPSMGAVSAAATTDPVGTEPPVDTELPVDTANPFFPEERSVTDCIGLVERPGCGSESRGGLHQNLAAIAMAAGLFLIFGRVGWVLLRSQQRAQDTTIADSPEAHRAQDTDDTNRSDDPSS